MRSCHLQVQDFSRVINEILGLFRIKHKTTLSKYYLNEFYFYFYAIKIKRSSIKKPWTNSAKNYALFSLKASKRTWWSLILKFLPIHKDAGKDMPVQPESPWSCASSEAELRRKLQKMPCTREMKSHALKANFRQHRDDVIFAARTQVNLQTSRV